MSDFLEKEGSPALPLYQQRPSEVKAAIEKAYASFSTSEQGISVYGRRGESETYHFGHSRETSSDQLIDRLLSRQAKRGRDFSRQPLQFLDIGTGYGEVLVHAQEKYGSRITVHGLNAPDFAFQQEELRGLNHQIGNAENLRDIYPPESFDLIVCSMTALHFVDPLGSLVQMHEALNPGGLLAVHEGIAAPGIEKELPALVRWLKGQGHQVAADFRYQIGKKDLVPEKITNLIIRKTQPSLRLPIKYEGVHQRDAQYSLTERLPKTKKIISPEIRRFLAQTPKHLHSTLTEGRINGSTSPEDAWASIKTVTGTWLVDLRRRETSSRKINEIKRAGERLAQTIYRWRTRRNQESDQKLQEVLAG
jgi:SAM-dependent methyltransferase